MPEFAFIDALSAYLSGPAGLDPAAVQVGMSEPTTAAEAPAVVLSLSAVRRLRGGLGEGAEPVEGVLPWSVDIDLASPFLPGDTEFTLLSEDRLVLTLPHGGLIRADGLDGALVPADLAVTVAGTPQTLVAADPVAGQFTVAPQSGQLTFGAPLPASGVVQAAYHLGAWERSAFLIAGELSVTARATAPAEAAALSMSVARALVRPVGLAGLKRLALMSAGPVDPGNPAHGGSRGQTAIYTFEYEHVVNAPASSGGIIATTPITTRLRLLRRDLASGALVEDTVTETG